VIFHKKILLILKLFIADPKAWVRFINPYFN